MRVAIERVGYHITLLHERQEFLQGRVRTANVNHNGQAGFVSGGATAPHAFEIVRPRVVLGEANLESHDQVPILIRRFDGEFRDAVAQVFEFSHVGSAARYHADRDHVQKSANPSSRALDNETAKGRKGEGAGGPRIDNGGDASSDTVGVRLDAVRADIGENVGMEINEPRRDDFSLGAEDLPALFLRDSSSTLAIFPPRTATSSFASRPWEGSITLPPLIRRS